MSRVTLTNPFDLLQDENEDRINVPSLKQSKDQKSAAPKAAPVKPAKQANGVAVAKPAASVAKPAAPKSEALKPAAPAAAAAAQVLAPSPAAPAAAAAAPKPADAQKPAPKPQSTGSAANQVVKPQPPRDANQTLQEREKESRPPRDNRDRPLRGSGGAGAAGDRSQGKRPYDRKSGTGRPQNEVKRGGHGQGNWGGEVDAKEAPEVLKEKEEKLDDKEDEETPKDEKLAPEAEVEEKKEEIVVKEKEEEKPVLEELGLEEYLAKLKQKAPKGVEALKPRTVNADDFGAAGLVLLQRGEEGVSPLKEKKDKKDKKKESPASSEKKTEKKEKSLAETLLRFSSHQDEKRAERFPRTEYNNNRGGGGGGGERRGGGQGGYRDRPPRSDNNVRAKTYQGPTDASATQPPVQLSDFPALGPHGADQPAKA